MSKAKLSPSAPDSLNGEGAHPSLARSARLADLLVEVARCADKDVAALLPSRFERDLKLDALRSVLMEQEQTALALLQQKFDDPQQFAEAVSTVLAEAFALSEARSQQLSKTLAPTLERAAQESIRKDPSTLVGILYPLMGPAIRKSIAESLDGTLQKLNQAFKHSFSWRGLKWRLEAFRTGSSFADVVLNHTVEFRVDHVFLIHKKTGLLLEHVAAPEAEGQDPQLVSGMLTAIQDFVRDSFSGDTRKKEGNGGGIDSLRLGDLLLWCEEGPFAFLAAVLRGNPPDTLRVALRETLTKIHEDLRIPLEQFEGDTASLTNLNTSLEGCLQQREQPEEKRLSPWLWSLPLALLMIVGLWAAWSALEARRIDGYVQQLRNEPGIAVTGVERRGWVWHTWNISGLRDPLAADPALLLAQTRLNPASVVARWESYQALSPAMVLKRFTATLDPPRGVSFALDGDVIRAHGSAPEHWVERARALIKALPAGSAQVDLSALTDVQEPTFVRLRDSIQTRVIKFHPNAPRPSPGQDSELDALANDLRDLNKVAGELGFSVRVMIVGHTDKTGDEMSNLTLSAARAEVIRSMLRARGIAPGMLPVRSTGTLEPLIVGGVESTANNRSVTFSVSTGD